MTDADELVALPVRVFGRRHSSSRPTSCAAPARRTSSFSTARFRRRGHPSRRRTGNDLRLRRRDTPRPWPKLSAPSRRPRSCVRSPRTQHGLGPRGATTPAHPRHQRTAKSFGRANGGRKFYRTRFVLRRAPPSRSKQDASHVFAVGALWIISCDDRTAGREKPGRVKNPRGGLSSHRLSRGPSGPHALPRAANTSTLPPPLPTSVRKKWTRLIRLTMSSVLRGAAARSAHPARAMASSARGFFVSIEMARRWENRSPRPPARDACPVRRAFH